MGIFGKSKKEKVREEYQRKSAEEAAERQRLKEEEYQLLAQAMERVNRLNPQWGVSIDKNKLAKLTEYKSDFGFYASFKSPDGIFVSFNRQENRQWMRERGGVYTEPGFCELTISHEATIIYKNKFDLGKFGLDFSKSWMLLDNYFRPLIESRIQQQNREKEEQKRRSETAGEAAKERFWSD